jgi:hypothetical protein
MLRRTYEENVSNYENGGGNGMDKKVAPSRLGLIVVVRSPKGGKGVGERGVERESVTVKVEGLRFVRSRLAPEVEGTDDDCEAMGDKAIRR